MATRLYNPWYHLISSAASLNHHHGWKFRHKLVRAVRSETSEYNRAILYYTVLYSGAGVPRCIQWEMVTCSAVCLEARTTL